MNIDLKTLLQAAPFPEENRQKIIAGFSSLTDDQKIRLANVCWTALSQMYFGQLKNEQDKIRLEIAEGKRQFNQADFEEAEKRLTREFTAKLKGAETEENIEEVRTELQKQLKKPISSTP